MSDEQTSEKHHNTKAEANRANAQHSTGPKTEEGKRIAAHNALKTGLTGRTVLLPTDDVAQYEAHLQRVNARYDLQTEEEQLLADTIAHAEWRLLRIPTLETGILAVGREECADLYPNHPLEVRIAMIDAKVHLTYGKQLANLALQEGRIRRGQERDVAKLKSLIKARQARKQSYLRELVAFYWHTHEVGRPFHYHYIRSLGLEFSVDDLKFAIAQDLARKQTPKWPRFSAEELLLTHDYLIDESPMETNLG